MRYSRIIATAFLSTFLAVILTFNTYAASESTPLDVYKASVYYAPSSQGGSGIYEELEPKFNVTNAEFTIPEHSGEFDGNNLRSIGVLFYAPTYEIDLQRGYIYTFNFTFRINNLDILPEQYELRFGVCNDDMSLTHPLSDIVFNYAKKATFYEYYCTAVIDVKSDIDFSYVGSPQELVYYLEIIGEWKAGSTVTLRNYTQSVTKAVGEEAYYQASLDAINGLPQTEYNYIYNSMPDSEGEADVIMGQLEDMYAQFNPFLSKITELFSSDVSKPCMYIPTVDIPFLNIRLFDAHIFYFDDYLNTMSPDIMPKIEVVLWFIRFGVCVTFIYVTYYKFVKIEWWI